MHRSNFEKFGKCCRTLRKNYGLTIKEACQGICDEGTLSRIENGRHFPHEKTLDQILEKYGEENFLERYIMAEKHERYVQKKDLRMELSHAIEIGQIYNMEERMLQFRNLIDNPVSEDMQFFLALQNIWYRMQGVALPDRSKTYIEIYEMKKKFPQRDDDLREIITNGTFSQTDHLLINCVGLSLIQEEKTNSACKVFLGLYTDIHEKLPQSPNKDKKLAITSNNMALALYKASEYEVALDYAKRAFDYGLRTMDLKLILQSVKVEIGVLKSIGRHAEARMKENYIAEVQKIFGAALERHEKKEPVNSNGLGIPVL